MSGEFTDRQVAELITKYKTAAGVATTDEFIELEIRFKDVTREMFETIYTYMQKSQDFGDGVLECSVNVISHNVLERSTLQKADETQYIRKLLFTKGIVTSDTYHRKLRLHRPVIVNDYMRYAIGVSKESNSNKFATTMEALVRFKIRISFDFESWRFDLTAVKHGSLQSLGATLKSIKQDLFTPTLDAKNFLQEVNFDAIDDYEVEIEYTGAPSALTASSLLIAKKIFTMINPQYLIELAYQDEIYHVATHIVDNDHIIEQFRRSSHRLKELSNQVYALNKNTYYADVYPPVGYYATLKIDGQRAIISANGARVRVLKSDTMIEYGTDTLGEINIVDAEMIVVDKKLTYYVFDVMVYRGENISKKPFSERIEYLQKAADLVGELIGDFARVLPKKYELLTEKLENGFRAIWDAPDDIPKDGIIITEPNAGYRDTRNYKWKPYSHNTIDCLAVKCPQKLLGIKPYIARPGHTLYLLFVGIDHQMREKLGLGFIRHYKQMFPEQEGGYYPIQFSPSADPIAYVYQHNGEEIDRKIVELSRNETNTDWLFHGVRNDRKLERNYFGNNFRIAELTYLNFIDPFDFEMLWKQSSVYFTKTANDIYKAGNKFRRFVISMLLKSNLSGAKWVIDEAAGRGGDLHRYQEIGVENALFIDVDPTAITELIRRKFSVFSDKKKQIRGRGEIVTKYDQIHGMQYDQLIKKDIKSLTVHTLVADLTTPHADLAAATYQYGINPGLIDGIVCNFALHYMCDTIEHLRNLLMFNAKMLKVGGVFIFTVMDGKSVFDLLKPIPTGGQWEMRENNVLKHAIKKKYTGDKFAAVGQTISVLLPLADEMYDEPLCNVDVVIAEATKLGFAVELNASMSSYMDKFAQAAPILTEQLTQDDRDYIKLHRYCSLRKIKDIKK